MTIDGVRIALRERIRRGATLEELDTLVRMTRADQRLLRFARVAMQRRASNRHA